MIPTPYAIAVKRWQAGALDAHGNPAVTYSAPESEHFTIAPVRTEPEGSRITLQPGFDAARVRVTGNVVGQPPFTGTLGHRGWQASDVRLPQLTDAQAARTLAQAEVEL